MRFNNIHKIILGGIIGIISFLNFSNAEIFVINGDVDNNTYNEYTFHTDIPINNFQATNRICTNGNKCQIYAKSASGYECGITTAVAPFDCNGTVVGDITIKYKTNLSWLKPFKQIVLSYFECPTCEVCEECETCPTCETCASTGEILSGYCDTNYCVNNDLCPIPENNSFLYINNIQHQSAPRIKITIPEEIQRDSNVDSGEFNLDVIGYGYDQDKMQQMVNTQYYKPTAEEMSGLIGKVADFLPLIAIALLVIRIRRIIKKVFKF